VRAFRGVRLLANLLLGSSLGVASLAWPAVPSALAQSAGTAPAAIPSCQYTTDTTHSFPFCSTGQMADVTVSPNSAVSYQFTYPGNNSNITVTAQLPGVDPTTATAVGFNVFDSTVQSSNPPAHVETATIQSNQLNSDPHSLQFNYSSGTAGPVTLQLFNYTPKSTVISLNDSGLVIGASNTAPAVTPVTLQLVSGATPTTGGAPAASPSAPTSAAPTNAAPTNAGGNPTSIPSCQYTTDTTHSFAFCSTGQMASVTVPANGTVNYRFTYPGDNSNITVTAQIPSADPTNATAMGFNVFDSTLQASNPPSPVETATVLSNQLNSDPHMLQFNYSSGTAGPVTLQLFNYTAKPAVISLNDSGLVIGSSNTAANVTPVTLQLA
jgi:hypothetical protein